MRQRDWTRPEHWSDRWRHPSPDHQGNGRRRLWRNTRRAMVGGVCAGIADHFGREPWQVRFLLVLGLIFFLPQTMLAYLLAWAILPARPEPAYRSEAEDAEWRRIAAHPNDTVAELDDRFRTLERRLEEVERTVTSPEFRLDREIRNLK